MLAAPMAWAQNQGPRTAKGWFDRPMRWAQVAVTEDDPHIFDRRPSLAPAGWVRIQLSKSYARDGLGSGRAAEALVHVAEDLGAVGEGLGLLGGEGRFGFGGWRAF